MREIRGECGVLAFLNTCSCETNIDSCENFIACNHTVEEIAEIIDVDSFGFLSVKNAKKLASGAYGEEYCTACFDGGYPTDTPSHTERNRFEGKKSAGNKSQSVSDRA